MYDSDYNGFEFITLHNHNKYARDNMSKFVKITGKLNILYGTCQNYKSLYNKNWDLFILLFNDTPKIRKEIESKINNLIPLYPIFDDSYLIITKLIGSQIYELADKCEPAHIAKLYIREMGGILKTPKSKFRVLLDYSGVKYPKLELISKDSTKFIEPNVHGWLSPNTRYCLKYTIQLFKKLINIVELGSWLGSSTCEIIESAKECNIYCFDHFQNVALTDYKFEKKEPLDKFWLTVPRYETFCKNISPYLTPNKKVYSVKYDVFKSISVLRYHYIMPHIVFIDAIKNKDKLLKFLQDIFQYAPNTIIVGDDYIIKSVQEAVAIFMKKYSNYWCLKTADCYILAKSNVFQDLGIKTQDALIKEGNAFINKQIMAKPFTHIVMDLFDKQYDKVCKDIIKLDINKPLEEFNNNTFYTLVIIEIYSKKEKSAEKVKYFILKNMDAKPKKIENALFLTWQDYMDNTIVF